MDSIRITSGDHRGRKIITPGGKTHPMGERERLALFNMIAPFIPEAMVLDAFSGSGALGIEALSRGAKHVVFVDNDKKAFETIKMNLKNLDLAEKTEVIKSAVQTLPDTMLDFDIILADPPYDNFALDDILYLTNFLKNGGIMALSHPGDTPVIDGLKLTKSRKYAGATLSIYEK